MYGLCVKSILYQALNLQSGAESTASPQPDPTNHLASSDGKSVDLDEINDFDLFNIPSSPLRPPNSPPYQPPTSPPYQHSSPLILLSDRSTSVDFPETPSISVLDLDDELTLQFPEEDIDLGDFEQNNTEDGLQVVSSEHSNTANSPEIHQSLPIIGNYISIFKYIVAYAQTIQVCGL